MQKLPDVWKALEGLLLMQTFFPDIPIHPSNYFGERGLFRKATNIPASQ